MKEIDWSKAPEGYDFALSTAADWNGAPELKGTVRFASRDGLGRFKDYTGMYPQIGRSSWEVIAERPVSWAGEGLPPVGTVCEVANPDQIDEWCECTVLAHDGPLAVFRANGDYPWLYDGTQAGNFRPIRTPEQIAAEEREKAVQQMLEDANSWGDLPAAVCLALYKAGYRKVTP